MKKVWITLLFVPLLFGCYARSGGIPLFNGYGYNYAPGSVVVQKGDTLYSLSRKYQVPLRGMIEENNLSAPYALNIGQTLRLPKRRTHIVAKGDTLYGISKKYNVDITSLSRLNGLDEPYTLNVGQALALPGSLAGSGSSGASYQIASDYGGTSSYSYTKGKTAAKRLQNNIVGTEENVCVQNQSQTGRESHCPQSAAQNRVDIPQEQIYLAGKRNRRFKFRRCRQRAPQRRNKHQGSHWN